MDSEAESSPEEGGGRVSSEAEEESKLQVRLESLMVREEAGRTEGEEGKAGKTESKEKGESMEAKREGLLQDIKLKL